MKIDAKVNIDISAKELGKIAANLDDQEIKAFWFSFCEQLGEYKQISAYGRSLSQSFGGNRKRIFESLYFSMKHYEHCENNK